MGFLFFEHSKKIVLVVAATLVACSAAFAQGFLWVQSVTTAGGVSTTTTNINSGTGWYTGSMTLEIFALSGGATVDQIAAINNAWSNPTAAYFLLLSDGFVQQSIDGLSSTNINVISGSFNIGACTIGDSGTLTTGSTVTYAIFGMLRGLDAVLAFNTSTTGNASPGGIPINFTAIWPNQNLYFPPVPEPATMALAGLGGVFILLFRSRK